MSGHLTNVSLPRWSPGNLCGEPDFAVALARRALTWHQQPDEAAALAAITADTPGLLRGADTAAVVTVSRSGTLQIKAAAGPIQALQQALPRALTPHQWTLHSASHPLPANDRWPVGDP